MVVVVILVALSSFLCFAALLFAVHLLLRTRRGRVRLSQRTFCSTVSWRCCWGCAPHTTLKSLHLHTHTHTKKHAQAHTHSLTHTNTNTVIPVLLSAQSPRLASHSIGAERRRDGYVDVGGDWKIGIFSAALQRRFVVAAAVFVVSAFAIRFDNRFISVYLLSRVAFTYYYLILLRFATLRVLWHVER